MTLLCTCKAFLYSYFICAFAFRWSFWSR